MPSVAVFSPAKINLYLAVTGRREDGFHDLVSLAAPLMVGDTVWVALEARAGPVSLTCNDPAVPGGSDNLAVRAAELFRRETGIGRAIHLELEKRLPMGAGLGGGSGNATAVLRGLNQLCESPLPADRLRELAAHLGSDCPLFLAGGPCLMRGRGERIAAVPAPAAAALRGRRVLLFKPDFPVSTPWAYGRLAADPARNYVDPAEAEARLHAWQSGLLGLPELLYNSFEFVVFRKFVALPTMADGLRRCRGVEGVLLSGSGSACFVLLAPEADSSELACRLREALGAGLWVSETVIS